MTLDQFQKATIVRYAYDEASDTGSLACMRAICYALRNRVAAGWHDGSWIAAVEAAPAVSGNDQTPRPILDISNRLFQMMLREVDDIFYGQSADETSKVVQGCLYFHRIDKPARPWFVENIVRDPQNHPRRGHVGPFAFFA